MANAQTLGDKAATYDKTAQASLDQARKPKENKSELLAASYREMLAALKRHYGMTGDLAVKAITERADHALNI